MTSAQSVSASTRANWAPLLDALYGRRRLVLAGYLVVLAVWFGLVIWCGLSAIPEVFHHVFGQGMDYSILGGVGLPTGALILGGFLLVQAAFLWGGGQIRLRKGGVGSRRIVWSVVIFAVLMALLSYGIIRTYFELINRTEASGLAGDDSGRMFLVLLAATWVPWMLVGWAAVSGTHGHLALSRLVTILLSGSWIEFTVALPVDLVTRPRTQSCPCAAGSWIGLLICVPVLLWAVGPALFLLYVRERRLAEEDPRHARQVLLGKSRDRTRKTRPE